MPVLQAARVRMFGQRDYIVFIEANKHRTSLCAEYNTKNCIKASVFSPLFFPGFILNIFVFMAGKNFFQFVKFMLLGLVGTVVEFIVFGLCNFLVFRKFASTAFSWFVFDYPVSSGGLCAFLAIAVSFACSQTANFIVQRRYTFKSSSAVASSAPMYAVMVCILYLYVLWLPSVIGNAVYGALGTVWGAYAVKIISQFTSALIQFPLNKFLIMR